VTRAPSPDLSVRIGALTLRNPVIAGSGEHTMTEAGIRAALEAGAAAVVAKSGNESEAAKQQLDGADYVLLDARWRPLPWGSAPPPDAQLFCRSGLIQREVSDWLADLAALDREAGTRGAYVVPSLILADLETAAALAARVEAAGLRVLEFNIGARTAPRRPPAPSCRSAPPNACAPSPRASAQRPACRSGSS
jgi:hypothetical protein